MKKLDKSIECHLAPFVMCEEELMELASILKEHCKDVKLIANETLEFDNANELIKHFTPSRIHKLKIRWSEPQGQIMFNTMYARIEFDTSTLVTLGLTSECANIIRRRSKFYGIMYSFPVFYPLLALLLVLAHFTKEARPYIYAFIIPYAVCIFLVRWTRSSLIYARKADGLEAFYLRNKDDLITKAVAGIVGGFLGYLFKALLDKSR